MDVDGVILDMVSKACEIYNKAYNTFYSKKDVKQWAFYKDWGISEKAMYKIFYEVYENSNLLPLIDNQAPIVLQKLNQKYQVDLVTARYSKYESKLLERLNTINILKDTHYNNLIHVEEKPSDAKLKLNYDILIDDNPNLATKINRFPNKTLLLYDQPWNRTIKMSKQVIRVYNWTQIKKELL
ncbi:MAG: hypothetical protein ACFFCI_22415 [Promethearchaeota archaeon]